MHTLPHGRGNNPAGTRTPVAEIARLRAERDALTTRLRDLGAQVAAYLGAHTCDRPPPLPPVYADGYALGHDTGYSARQDTRGYIRGILDGYAAGVAARHHLTDHLLRRPPRRRLACPTCGHRTGGHTA